MRTGTRGKGKCQSQGQAGHVEAGPIWLALCHGVTLPRNKTEQPEDFRVPRAWGGARDPTTFIRESPKGKVLCASTLVGRGGSVARLDRRDWAIQSSRTSQGQAVPPLGWGQGIRKRVCVWEEGCRKVMRVPGKSSGASQAGAQGGVRLALLAACTGKGYVEEPPSAPPLSLKNAPVFSHGWQQLFQAQNQRHEIRKR